MRKRSVMMMAEPRSFWLALTPLCLCLAVLLAPSHLAHALNLYASAPTVYSGPMGSYFGFSLDFYQNNNGSMSMIVGAPRANSTQPGVTEGGAVFLCPWAPAGSSCSVIEFDQKGDQKQGNKTILQTYKSHQWLGASVSSWKDGVVACAPLQHWNALQMAWGEASKTPVGSCFMATDSLSRFAEYAPCRETFPEAFYKENGYLNDRRYCELGFSTYVTQAGTLLIGAPGGYYFGGLIYSVNVSVVVERFPSFGQSLLLPVPEGSHTGEVTQVYNDGYRGYSVAMGEFNNDPSAPEYVVGVPNKHLTQGEVEIFALRNSKFKHLWSLPSHQVASYFGHTVTVTDVNGDGKDDILVGAPTYMEYREDRKLYEVGQVYLYLQTKAPHAYRTPSQTLTGTDVYGRFGMSIAPLGDLDQDGYTDVAVGAPFAGRDGGGCVYIFRGYSEGLGTVPAQVLDSPFPGHAAFGFAVRGASDIDVNGYPDVLVGAFKVSKVAAYRSQPVVMVKAQLLMPNMLNPEEKICMAMDVSVSCFTIQMCVSVSGKNIPPTINLDAELQLDRMKLMSGRRILVLETSHLRQSLRMVLLRDKTTHCQNVTAYLRIHIVLDCGEDNICIPELQLSAHTNEDPLLIGAENIAHLLITAANVGEGAYEAELVVLLPPRVHFQRAVSSTQGLEKLLCSPRKENETRLVACELGNPMKKDTKVTVDVELSVSRLEEAGENITFQVQLRSKNTPSSEVAWVQVPVKAATWMELRGNSLPASVMLPLVGWEYRNASRKPEDYGPKVEHVYQLHNQGPGMVTGVEIAVGFPSRFQGDFFLYITGLSTDAKVNCSHPIDTNPLQLDVLQPTASPEHNASFRLVHRRERRQAVELGLNTTQEPGSVTQEESEPATLQEPVVVNCSSEPCVTFLCQVDALERDQRATLTIQAVLWLQSFHKRPLEQFIIQSQGWYNVSGMPYHLQPDVLPSGSSMAETRVEWVNPDAERKIPIWWVVGAVLTGLLLLAVLAVVLWKMGFFKRRRLPTEEEEEPINGGGGAGTGQGQ
uniref:Integrin subunit alpha 2b n=1 Tax=Sphenodon punctatus TaxID=8508 RepID=A0A8D0GVU0_SPHPU